MTHEDEDIRVKVFSTTFTGWKAAIIVGGLLSLVIYGAVGLVVDLARVLL